MKFVYMFVLLVLCLTMVQSAPAPDWWWPHYSDDDSSNEVREDRAQQYQNPTPTVQRQRFTLNR